MLSVRFGFQRVPSTINTTGGPHRRCEEGAHQLLPQTNLLPHRESRSQRAERDNVSHCGNRGHSRCAYALDTSAGCVVLLRALDWNCVNLCGYYVLVDAQVGN